MRLPCRKAKTVHNIGEVDHRAQALTYSFIMHEDILNQRYHESVQTVLAELKKVIPRIELTGQWSVDVMRNGNDYYIIDMALAENSALNDCVPKNLLRAYPQQWLPGESNS